VGIRIEVDLNGAGHELDRLMAGPGPGTIARLESALMTGYMTSLARVHVITGYLKSSLHPDSQFGGDSWTGTISAARYPGIFELARGNAPTRYHVEGGHYFFGPGGQDFEREVREAIWDWVTDDHGGPAPSEGLGWKSGGDG
jgi:hypothetical protein